MRGELVSFGDEQLDRKKVYSKEATDFQNSILKFAQRYQAFFDSTSDAIAVFSPTGEILDANPQLLNLGNYSYEAIVLKNLRDIFDDKSYEELWTRFQILLEGRKRKYPIVGVLLTRSGRRRPVEMSLSLLKNQYGYSETILAVMRDVTRRKEMEVHLVQKAEELQKVFNAVPTILFVIDERRRIRRVNRSGLEAVDREEKEVLGRRVGEILKCVNYINSPKGCGFGKWCRDCVLFESILRCLRAGQTVLNAEESIVRESIDRSPYYYRINVVPLETRGKRWGVVSLEDITDKKKAEREFVRLHNSITRANVELKRTLENFARSQSQLLESQKLEQIGLLASGFTHNLKTPLAGIKGYAQLLKMDYDDLKELDLIVNEVEVMEEIINNLMLKSRKDHESREEMLNLNNLLEIEMKFLSADMFFKHSVTKEIDLDKNLPPVLGVYSHFSQIIMNIIQNSLDAMHNAERKKMTIRTRYDEQYIYLEISDTGCGIPDEYQDKIFNFFFTTKPTTKEREGDEPIGTGLGLSSANYFIRQYGGKIDVNSKLGEGTTATVKVPRLQRAEQLSLPRVLVVDDDDNMVNILIRVCQDMGMEAYGTPDGKKALRLYNKLKPHVVISDLCLPGLTGPEMMSEIRKLNPDQKVIYISAYSENPEFRKWLEHELERPTLCSVMKKPFQLDNIRENLQRMVFE